MVGGIRDFAVILEVHAFWTKFCKGYPLFGFNFYLQVLFIYLGGVLGLNPGVANLFGARAKLFGKTLQWAFFALAAKISKSS